MNHKEKIQKKAKHLAHGLPPLEGFKFIEMRDGIFISTHRDGYHMLIFTCGCWKFNTRSLDQAYLDMLRYRAFIESEFEESHLN